jgi:hypothetical protein
MGESEPAADGLLTLRVTATALGATDCFEKLDVMLDVPQLSRERRRLLSVAAATAATATARDNRTSMASSDSDHQQLSRELISYSNDVTDYSLVRGHHYTQDAQYHTSML